jgi:hypothetical protein
MIFLDSKIKVKKVCIAMQVNEPPSYLDIEIFINILFWPSKYYHISATYSTLNL